MVNRKRSSTLASFRCIEWGDAIAQEQSIPEITLVQMKAMFLFIKVMLYKCFSSQLAKSIVKSIVIEEFVSAVGYSKPYI